MAGIDEAASGELPRCSLQIKYAGHIEPKHLKLARPPVRGSSACRIKMLTESAAVHMVESASDNAIVESKACAKGNALRARCETSAAFSQSAFAVRVTAPDACPAQRGKLGLGQRSIELWTPSSKAQDEVLAPVVK